MEHIEVKAGNGCVIQFSNQVDYCVGTGRMGLALQKEYQEQLRLVQEYIGFSYIRGHGLFCEDMGIYQEEVVDGERIVEYNFTYLDLVMDSYRALGLKPFLELGFMPKTMASGTQTVFYWKGNVTPPKDYEDWKKLVQATLRHLCDRYGHDEVVTWPVEVWNEPNLTGFWENADMKEYFRLFECTFYAVKEVDERFRVGGPAVCGGTDEIWIQAFMEFVNEKNIPVDFVTRHHYTTEIPKREGHYGYAALSDPEEGFANLHTTREIIDRFPKYEGLQIHVTEYNTSYVPNCPLHDTNQNAAYIAQQLSRLGDDNESYSYWTFGDIFEEFGVPFTPFHGGFGLVANGCIPKPTFWTFCFYKQLKELPGTCVYRDEHMVILKLEDGRGYRGILWNHSRVRTGHALQMNLHLDFAGTQQKDICLITKTVDETTCNPLKLWHDLGEPSRLSMSQKELLKAAAVPFVKSDRVKVENGEAAFSVLLEEHGVVYFEAYEAEVKPDRGYDYERVVHAEQPER